MMTFEQWIKVRSNTKDMHVVEVTQRRMRPNILGVMRPYNHKTTELKKPQYHDNKSLFVQMLMIKLKASDYITSWESFLGWLVHWKAIEGTIVLAKSLWKQYTRAMRNLRIRDGYAIYGSSS